MPTTIQEYICTGVCLVELIGETERLTASSPQNPRMASLSGTIAHLLHHHHHHHHPPSSLYFSLPSHSHLSFPCSVNHSPIHVHHSFSGLSSNPNRFIRRCQLGSAGPPPSPPERPEPGPGNHPVRPTGFGITLSRIWDSIQIFFAVLFWMALFFWTSAMDGRNSGRRNKGTRFRR